MKANSRLRAVLALGYGGLLALLVYSGASALQTLRKLHEAEETARANSLEREHLQRPYRRSSAELQDAGRPGRCC